MSTTLFPFAKKSLSFNFPNNCTVKEQNCYSEKVFDYQSSKSKQTIKKLRKMLAV